MTDRNAKTDPAPPPGGDPDMTPRTKIGLQRLTIAKVEVVRSQLDRITTKLEKSEDLGQELLRSLQRIEANQTLEREERLIDKRRIASLEERVERLEAAQ